MLHIVLFSLLFLPPSVLGERVNQTLHIAPTHPGIQYNGRWVFKDTTEAQAEWQGASITVWLESHRLEAILDGGTETEYFRIIINDDVSTTRKIAVSPGKSTYTLASSLPPGTNKVELVKETYVGEKTTFFGFLLNGNDPELIPPPSTPSRYLLFYGDSNLAGYSLESEHNESDFSLRGSYFGLAGITSRMFDAAYQNISISGASISSLHAVFDQASRWNPKSKVDVAQYHPDAVIINLGANDVGNPKEEIKKEYHRFLDTLRVIHPDAQIILFNAWGWDYNEPANFTHEVAAERNDKALSVSTFPWLFETWHGCEYDHAGMAQVLTDHLKEVLGWNPKPPDVLVGYGKDGNVANGSFEESSPFGGYGWRYFREPGVQRIKNSEAAKEGNYYVSLANQTAIHQPNPAHDGDVVSVKLWLKGSTVQDHAKIKIDFRDQKMWTRPLQTDSLIVKLSPKWTQFKFEASAPEGGNRPVYHTRLTISPEGPQSRIDVDDISMSVRPAEKQ